MRSVPLSRLYKGTFLVLTLLCVSSWGYVLFRRPPAEALPSIPYFIFHDELTTPGKSDSGVYGRKTRLFLDAPGGPIDVQKLPVALGKVSFSPELADDLVRLATLCSSVTMNMYAATRSVQQEGWSQIGQLVTDPVEQRSGLACAVYRTRQGGFGFNIHGQFFESPASAETRHSLALIDEIVSRADTAGR